MKDISKSIKKTDSDEKISGSAKYIADIKIDGMLHAVSLRSKISKGRIKEIKFPIIPDGYHIVSHKDIPGINIVKIIFEDQLIFPVDEVTYLYEPILLVVGPDKQIVVNIINQIEVVYIEETPVFDWVNSAIEYKFDKGNGLVSFDDVDQVIKYDYETGYQEQAYIEPQGFVGYLEDEKVTLIGSIQCPYYVKKAVVQALDAEPENVRIIQPSIGGAFGGKEEFPSLIACQLAVAIKKIKKPIQLLYEREEDMNCTTKRHHMPSRNPHFFFTPCSMLHAFPQSAIPLSFLPHFRLTPSLECLYIFYKDLIIL